MDDLRAPTLRTQRLRLVWLLALPFLYMSLPHPRTLLLGLPFSLSGILLRSWAAGSIQKDRELATGGPYGHLRHPLYLGSFLLGFGLSLAGGRWWFPLLFSALFIWVYRRTVLAEEAELTRRFGEGHESYLRQVPSFLPSFGGHEAPGPGFSFPLYRRNKEWQAALGALVGYGLLWMRMSLAL
jgi:protein-S-isoprenylcysteine O-methyltransferase Ste14